MLLSPPVSMQAVKMIDTDSEIAKQGKFEKLQFMA